MSLRLVVANGSLQGSASRDVSRAESELHAARVAFRHAEKTLQALEADLECLQQKLARTVERRIRLARDAVESTEVESRYCEHMARFLKRRVGGYPT